MKMESNTDQKTNAIFQNGKEMMDYFREHPEEGAQLTIEFRPEYSRFYENIEKDPEAFEDYLDVIKIWNSHYVIDNQLEESIRRKIENELPLSNSEKAVIFRLFNDFNRKLYKDYDDFVEEIVFRTIKLAKPKFTTEQVDKVIGQILNEAV